MQVSQSSGEDTPKINVMVSTAAATSRTPSQAASVQGDSQPAACGGSPLQ